MEEEPLKCSWLAPSEIHGIFRNYTIKVKLDGQLIHSGFTKRTIYKKKPDFVAIRGHNYDVIVSAMTHTEGSPASTKINFINTGELQSKLICQICQ